MEKLKLANNDTNEVPKKRKSEQNFTLEKGIKMKPGKEVNKNPQLTNVIDLPLARIQLPIIELEFTYSEIIVPVNSIEIPEIDSTKNREPFTQPAL